jgi:integrase/recombinase XerD
VEQGKGEATVKAYLGDVERFRDYLDTNCLRYDLPLEWDQVTDAELRRYLAWLSEKRTVKRKHDEAEIKMKPVGPRYTRRVLSALSVWFDYLTEVEKLDIHPNPPRKLKRPKLPIRNPEANTQEEITLLINTALEHSRVSERVRNWTLIAFLYHTGLRNFECARLKMTDVRFKGGLPHSVRVIGKGNKERVIPLRSDSQGSYQGDGGSRALHQWLKERTKTVAELPPNSPHKDYVWLIPSGRKKGQPLTTSGIRAIYRRFSAIAGIAAHPHKMRHSFATHAVQNGAKLHALQAALGHSSLQVTGMYLHADQKELENVVAVLPSVMDGAVESVPVAEDVPARAQVDEQLEQLWNQLSAEEKIRLFLKQNPA